MYGFGVMGGLFIGLYSLVLVVIAVLVIWVLILAVTFLRLRIAEIRGTTGSASRSA
ncbi:putative membrane protein [Arthrobacter sp. UYCu511]